MARESNENAWLSHRCKLNPTAFTKTEQTDSGLVWRIWPEEEEAGWVWVCFQSKNETNCNATGQSSFICTPLKMNGTSWANISVSCFSSFLGSSSSYLSQNGRRVAMKASWDVQLLLGQYGCRTGIKVFGGRRCIFSQDGLRLQICALSMKHWKGNWAVDGDSPPSPSQLELTCQEERTTDERD